MKKWLPIITLSLGCPCFAQQDSIAPFFREFEDKISTQLFILNNSNNFTITSLADNVEVELVPNNKSTLNLGVQYDIISFSIGFAPQFFEENHDNKGSRMRSLSFGFFPGRWVQRLEYHNQKGISINPVDVSTGIYLEHLKSTKIGGSTNFFFNRKFSYRGTALQNVQQLHSAGSFSLGLTYNYTELNGKEEPILPIKTSFFDVAITPGYTYNWVIGDHVNLVAGIAIGAGISYSNDDGSKTNSPLYTSSVMLAPGYNADKWFFGINVRAAYLERKIGNEASVGDTMSYSTIFVGYRFDAPKALVSKTKQIKSKFNKKISNYVPITKRQTLTYQRIN